MAASPGAGAQQPEAGGAQQDVLDPHDWQSVLAHLQQRDEHRETIIKRARDAQKAAKQAIYALHRGAFARANEQLLIAERVGLELQPIVSADLRPGSYAAAMEEFAEAMILRTFLQEDRILTSRELAPLVSVEEYLGGLLDFTGELGRHAVQRATRRDVAAVQRAASIVDALQGLFLQLDLRNGALRKKFDTLKYTLKRLETMLYELSLVGAPGLRGAAAPPGEESGGDGDGDGDGGAGAPEQAI